MYKMSVIILSSFLKKTSLGILISIVRNQKNKPRKQEDVTTVSADREDPNPQPLTSTFCSLSKACRFLP